MAEITAALVKQLRDATNVSMMECKRALTEAGGDRDKATRLLRERGMVVAQKRSARVANQGLIASTSSPDGSVYALVEVNCETDFVARNPGFATFVAEMAKQALTTDSALADEVKDRLLTKIAEVGENIVVRRNARFVRQGVGAIASYIHLGGKVGVLVELGCQKTDTPAKDVFKEILNDLLLHVAAAAPRFLVPADVPADEIASERAIFAKQVEGKPANIVDKIVDGKMKKFYADTCLVDQGFVKEPKQSITDLLGEKSRQLGDTLTIRRFVRYQLGA